MDDIPFQEKTKRGPLPAYHHVENCDVEVPRPAALIIFGASGALAHRKLVTSLYRLYKNRMLAEQFFILGTSRVEMTTEQYRASMHDAIKTALPRDFDETIWNQFAPHIYYSTFDYGSRESYTVDLADILPRLESKHQTTGNRIFYLAIPPSVFTEVIHNLGAAGL